MNRKKKILAIIITAAIICGAVVGVSAGVRHTTSGGKVMVIPAEELNYGYGYMEGESMEGYVTSDRTQNVRLSSSQSVKEIKVGEGQQVKKGDILLEYDMTQTEINLEKAQLNLDLLKMGLGNAEEALRKLRNTSPSSGDGDDGEGRDTDDDDDDNGEKEKTVKKPKAADTLTGKSKPYYDAESGAEPGSEANPYRFLVKAGATVTADFINMVKKLQEDKQNCYFVLELRENDSWEGKLIRSWTQNASDVISPEKDWIGIIDPDNEKPVIPTKTFAEIEELEKQLKDNEDKIKELDELKKKMAEDAAADQTESQDAPADQGTDEQGSGSDTDSQETGSDTDQTIADLNAQIEALKAENDRLQTEINALQSQNNSSESEDEEIKTEESTESVSSGSTLAEETALRMTVPAAESAVYRKITPVTAKAAIVRGNGAVAVLTDLEEIDEDDLDLDSDDSDLSDSDEDDEEADEKDTSPGALDSFDPDASYTKDELAEAIKAQEESIADMKLDIREAKLKVKSAKKALEKGSVKAVLDGVVTRVEDIETARIEGSPVVSVSGTSGVAVKGGLPEKYLDTIQPGDIITVASWTNGMQYTATITEVSPYPDTSGMFDGGMSYNNSCYPFVAIIDDENAEMEEHDWVQISVDANTLAQDDGFYLMRAFILEEGTGAYVYKRGEDGLLHRQAVKLGKLSGDSYEILSGLTAEDWVAFPYGKNIKEGAQTREGTMEELYNS